MPSNIVEVIIRARDEAAPAIRGFNTELKTTAASLAIVTGAAAGLTAVFYENATATAEAESELKRLSAVTGEHVEQLSLQKAVAEGANVSFDAYVDSLRFLQRAQFQAVNGSDEMVKAFKRVGVSVNDLKSLSTEDLFSKISEGERALGSESERTATTMTLLGRRGAEIKPLLNLGADAMADARDRAKELGGEVTTLQSVIGEEYQNAVREANLATGGLKRTIGDDLLPTMIDLANQATQVAVSLRHMAEEHPALIRATAITSAQTAAFGTAILGALGSVVLLKSGLAALGVTMTATGTLVTGGIVAALVGLDFWLNKAREDARQPFELKTVTDIPSALVELQRLGEERKKLVDQIADLEARTKVTPEVLHEKGIGTASKPSDALGSDAELQTKRELLRTLDESLKRLGLTIQDLNGKPLKPPPADLADPYADVNAQATQAAAAVARLTAERDKLLEKFGEQIALSKSLHSFGGDIDLGGVKDAEKEIDTLNGKIAEQQMLLDGLQKMGAKVDYKKLAKDADELAGAVQGTADAWKIASDANQRFMDQWHKDAEQAQKELHDISTEPLEDPFLRVNPQITEFLKQAGLSNDEIVRLMQNLEMSGKIGDDVFVGWRVAIEGLRKEIEEGVLQPVLVMAQGITQAILGAIEGVSQAIGNLAGDFVMGGKRAQDAWANLGQTLHRVLAQFISDLIAAIAKALILAAIKHLFGLSGGGEITSEFSGGGEAKASRGGDFYIPAPTPRMALGGLADFPMASQASRPEIRAAQGMTLAGGISAQDTQRVMVSPGERLIVLPTIGGRSPNAIVNDVDNLRGEMRETTRALRELILANRSGGGFTMNVVTIDALSLRDQVRYGRLFDEQQIARDLGRTG